MDLFGNGRQSEQTSASGEQSANHCLLLPEFDVESPEFSIVVPACNEEITIAAFIQWCKEGIAKVGGAGEILIVDSSTDDTALIALEEGARVLKTPKRGLGQAYIDAIPYIRGEYVIMGDADCTYDFRHLELFLEELRRGNDFVMGSRWKGSIEKGSMPFQHQYFGTPATTWMLNQIYGSKFSDIHCGMRAVSKDALVRMRISSTSWEYASEMVLKSVRMNLKTIEVPVAFYKNRDGRLSHHKRAGWFSPIQAGWINLKTMFIHRAEFFLLKPGLVAFVLGLMMTLPLSFGSIRVGVLRLSLYWMLCGMTLTVVGMEAFYLGCVAQSIRSRQVGEVNYWAKRFNYNVTAITSICISFLGLMQIVLLTVYFFTHHLSLPSPESTLTHLAVTGLLMIVVGFSTFGFVLVLQASTLD